MTTPVEEDSPDPDLMLTPGLLVLESSRLLPEPGEVITLTVEVWPDPSQVTVERRLKLELPAGLHLTRGEQAWTLLPEDAQDPFHREVTVQVAEDVVGRTLKVEVALEGKGFARQKRSLLLGAGLRQAGQELTVLVDPADAAPGGERLAPLAVSVEPLVGGPEADANRAEAASVHVYLPLVGSGQGEVFRQADDYDGLVRVWQVEARRGTKQAEGLSQPATLVIAADGLLAAGVDPEQLSLYTRESVQDEWRLVPAEYRPGEKIYVAQVRHFSQWGLGGKLSASGELLPSVKGFTSDGFTGYAQVSYPIETPSGLGGMQPGLSLSYSSGVPDDMENFNGDFAYEVQASWVGHGWNLAGVSYIARDFGSGDYALVLNGMSTTIKWVNNKWVTDPEQFIKIEHEAPGTMRGYYRYEIGDWVITAKDGTKYYFGSDQYTSGSGTDGGEPIGNWTEVIFRNPYLSDARKSVCSGSKWWLRQVVDPLGNRMEYDYDREIDYIGGECTKVVWWPGAWLYYTRATYVKEIRWSANASINPQVPARLKVVFTREARPDWQVSGWDQRCVQARFGKERLKTVSVLAYDAPSNSWTTLRKLVLNYIQNELHSILSSINHYGKNGTSLLHTYSFGYTGAWNTVRLDNANNGQGGSTSFGYGYEEINDCVNCYQINWRVSMPRRRPVVAVPSWDGVGGMTKSVYAYSGVKGHVVNGSFEYLGHAWSRQIVETHSTWVSPEIHRQEQQVETWYRQRLNSNTIDPRRGRAYQSRTYAPSGGLMQAVDTDWNTVTGPNGTNWVRKDAEHVRIYDNDGNDNEAVQHTYYFYESTYGNQIRVEERAGNGTTVLRKTVTDYTFNTALYIVDRPWRVRVYDSSGACRKEVRNTYDGVGQLIKSEQPTSWCGDTNAANLIVTHKSYDGVGNVTDEWVDGVSRHIHTDYEGMFKLFPVRRYETSNSGLDETVAYYGVSGGASAGSSGGYWGAVQEFCGVDNLCTRQRYDDFGRPVLRWERDAQGSGWRSDSQAEVRWYYYPYGTSGSTANIVVEWRAPRCYGNFSRKLYNGFGQLIQEQGPDENWITNMDGCNPGSAGGEVVVDHAYDGLGREIWTSTPRNTARFAWSTSAPWTPNWSNGVTKTTYDAAGRVRQVTEPNGRVTTHNYSVRASSVVVSGNGEPDRLVNWQDRDELGRTTLLRTYTRSGTSWLLDAEVRLSYDAQDNLTKVERKNANAGSWTTLTTLSYDLAGRKTSMWDADLGSWSYSYDKLGQMVRQTDARNKSTCLSYNALGQVTSKLVYHSGGCSGSVAAQYSYSYDGAGRLSNISRTQPSADWSKSLTYTSKGLPWKETVTIDGYARTLETIYDAWNRPYATKYPDGEVVKVNFNSMGLPKLMCRAYWNGGAGAYYCDSQAWLVSDAHYDAAGRLTSMKFPAGGNLWRTQSYYGWTESKNGGLLDEIKVGTTNGGSQRFYRKYTYNSFGDVATLQEGGTTWSFGYDTLGRLTSAYGKNYSYWPTNRIYTFEGKSFSYNDSHPYHGVKSDSYGYNYSYDANGNLVSVMAGMFGVGSFTWDAENRLVQAIKNGVTETYAYDVDGARIKRVSGSVTTRTWFPVYEEENGTKIKYYVFNGMTVAVKRGSSLYYLHGDHLSSTSLTTHTGGGQTAGRAYYAYGSIRSSSGTLQTDRTFTGQKSDDTGLLYYNARYYDPSLGTFLSPDTLVPDPGAVIDYNRFAYARTNPMKYSDPSGHAPQYPGDPDPDNAPCSTNWCWQNRWYMARGYGWDGNGWSKNLGLGGAVFYDSEILNEVLSDGGMTTSGDWTFEELSLVGQAVVDFARKIGGLFGVGVSGGLERLRSVTGPVRLHRQSAGWLHCVAQGACTWGNRIEFYDSVFTGSPSYARASVVHELAHVINNVNCNPNSRIFCGGIGFGIPDRTHHITNYGERNGFEYWAEAVTDWVYGTIYKVNEPGRGHLTPLQVSYIEGVFRP